MVITLNDSMINFFPFILIIFLLFSF